MENKRLVWVDDVKVFACILVVLGHFFQSMTKSGLLPDGQFLNWFEHTIYCFHVPLFFLCSGFLYQNGRPVNSGAAWSANVRKKALTLGVPYVAFSLATWILKKAFSSSVNDAVGGLADALLLHPMSPYWYLYGLFFLFLLVPTIQNRKMAWGLAIAALGGKCLVLAVYPSIAVLQYLGGNGIWFAAGMLMRFWNLPSRASRKLLWPGIVLGIGFAVMSWLVGTEFPGASILYGAWGCSAVVLTVLGLEGAQSRLFTFLSRYTMPIFLMHTLFAAPVRTVLLKLGMHSGVLHVLIGLGVSFLGPIVGAEIMKKLGWPEFFLYPGKFAGRRQ